MNLRNILLVEDNPDHIFLIEEALDKDGIGKKTYVVNDGEEALDFLYNNHVYKNKTTFPRPDLILLDLKLPRLSGLEVLREIKSDQKLKCIPVIIVSSSLQQIDVAAAYKAGVNSYIAKPVNFDEFAGKIRQIKNYWLQINILPESNTGL